MHTIESTLLFPIIFFCLFAMIQLELGWFERNLEYGLQERIKVEESSKKIGKAPVSQIRKIDQGLRLLSEFYGKIEK